VHIVVVAAGREPCAKLPAVITESDFTDFLSGDEKGWKKGSEDRGDAHNGENWRKRSGG
jgi:hypothetical protein